MKIKSITAEGFKSLYKETTITFPESGLWKISGDVGVGKTTLGECVLFCLFGSVKDKNIKNLISWGKKKCTTSIELESRGHDIIINRLIKLQGQGNLEIFIDGQLLEYTNKRDGQQILEEDYFDITRTAAETLCIVSFNNFKSIVHLSSGSAETRKFIDDVFGFNIVNKYIDKTKEHLLKTSEDFNNINIEINTLEVQKEKYELSRDAINNNIDCDKIEEINNSINSKKETMDTMIALYNEQRSVYTSSQSECSSKMAAIKEKGKHTRTIISKLNSGVCPLCGGVVSKESLEEYNKELQELLEEYNRYKNIYDNATIKLKDIDSRHKKELLNIQNEIQELRNEVSKINMQQKLLSNNYDKLINDIDKNINEKQELKNNLESEKNKWQELYDKLYKESRPTLLRYYIPTMNNNINYYMQEMQQPYTIKFDEMFNCTISAFGIDDIPVSNLSTGQSKLVDTAVILGIIKTLLNGVNMNILFLDELFSNAHADLREMMCKMLKNNIKDRVVYIITHADINDDLFDGIIKTKMINWDEDDKLIHNTEYIIT